MIIKHIIYKEIRRYKLLHNTALQHTTNMWEIDAARLSVWCMHMSAMWIYQVMICSLCVHVWMKELMMLKRETCYRDYSTNTGYATNTLIYG